MKKSFIRIVGFLVILGICLRSTNSILKFKYGDGIYSFTKFYEQEKDSVDVLILGSSHAFEDINTGILWDDYGIASYILGGSVQPLWNSYYNLVEALKTQHPSLILLEGYCTSLPVDYNDTTRIIKNTYGMHWSMNKINALKASAPQELWPSLFLEYTQYHNRYSEMTSEDFLPDQGNPLFTNWKGFACNMDTLPYTTPDVHEITDCLDLNPKAEDYYRRTIELAQSENIPIFIVISPYPSISEDEQRMFNQAQKIAQEYAVPFINYNLLLEEIGIDYSSDAGDPVHLNFRGNQKYTRYLGQYIKENYEIADHRNDAAYASWQENADYIRSLISSKE